MITWKCYEPAGEVLSIDKDGTSKHVLIVGATGSGKTTGVIDPAIEQLLAHRFLGVCVIDPKGDDTPHRVRHYAARHGRLEDVVVLGSQWSTSHYDLFAGLRRLDQVDEYAARLMAGSAHMGSLNVYWEETRRGLVASLLSLVLANGAPVTLDRVLSLARAWWLGHGSDDRALVTEACRIPKQLVDSPSLPPTVRSRLNQALDDVRMWAAMDHRTKENHRSTLANVVRPLSGVHAQMLLTPFRHSAPWCAADALRGKVLVASVNAQAHPELSRLVLKLIKRDIFAALQARGVADPQQDPFVGVVMDEAQLCLERDDVAHLGTLRSRGAGLIAATQSISALWYELGPRTQELLANFGSCFFFRCQDPATDVLAQSALGHSKQDAVVDCRIGGKTTKIPLDAIWTTPVCPPGTLSQLGQHQAFVKLIDGSAPSQLVWLAPSYLPVPARQAVTEESDGMEAAIAAIRRQQALSELFDSDASPLPLTQDPVQNLEQWLLGRGRKRRLTPRLLAAAFEILRPRGFGGAPWEELGMDLGVEGVEHLPACWQVGLIGWLLTRPIRARMVGKVWSRDGVLCVRLRSGKLGSFRAEAVFAASINLSLYPSLWRPLKRRHWVQLRNRPELLEDLNLAAARSA